jgi:chromosomal replication initiation ATPase DnaA
MNASVILDALVERDLVELLDTVCAGRGVTRDEICGRVRTRTVARARQELWWRLRAGRAFSYEEIGRLFQRNHSTVLHGIRAYRKACPNDGAAAAE